MNVFVLNSPNDCKSTIVTYAGTQLKINIFTVKSIMWLSMLQCIDETVVVCEWNGS